MTNLHGHRLMPVDSFKHPIEDNSPVTNVDTGFSYKEKVGAVS